MADQFWRKPESNRFQKKTSFTINDPEIQGLLQSIKQGASRKGGDPTEVMLKTFLSANYHKYMEKEVERMSAMTKLAVNNDMTALEPTVDRMAEAFLSSLTFYSGLAIISGTLRCCPHLKDEQTAQHISDLCDNAIKNLEQIKVFAKGPLIEMLRERTALSMEDFAAKWKDKVDQSVTVKPVKFHYNRSGDN